jgi:Flp pilus assembly protein protease CpaA
MTAIDIIITSMMAVTAVAGTVTDLWKSKIYDWLTWPALVLGVAVQSVGYGWGEIFGLGFVSSISGALFCLMVFGAFAYWKRNFGLGDVKLLAALGAQGGFLRLLELLAFATITGALLAVGWLLWGRGGILRRQSEAPAPTVPYALAILTGTLLSLARQLGWFSF